MHLFWLVLVVPVVALCQWIWPVLRQRSIWFVLILITSGLIVGWLAMGLPGLKSNALNVGEISKMFAFRLAAYTDFPLVQLLAASVFGWLRSKRSPKTKVVPAETESKLAAE